ncbi:MAG: hypothetical protein IJR88_03765 [Clostridia bacterium]|nr:hypothetical protein [Clostridia bacterium]
MADRADKIPQEGAKIHKNRFLLGLENYWYHYKWHTIVALFFAFTLLFCLIQCVGRKEPDILLVAAGDIAFSNTDARDGFVAALETVSPEKKKGDGKRSIQISHYTIFSEEQMKELSTDGEGNYSPATYASLKANTQTEYDAFTSFRMTGECSLYFVSDYVYENSNLREYAVPLSELFETAPNGALDEYSIRFSELAFYRYYAACKALPKDFRLVLVKPLVVGKASNEDAYGAFRDLFVAILSFEAP